MKKPAAGAARILSFYSSSALRAGGLGVFAFHDVPSRRFAPSFVYFWDSCKHSVELGSLFCLGRLCERRWLSSSPKLVTPLVICSQRKVVSTPEENASFATSPKRFFPHFWIETPRRRHLVFQKKVQPLFWRFDRCDFFIQKSANTSVKSQNFFWGASLPRPP